MSDSGLVQWAFILVLTALCLSLVVVAQVANAHWAAYMVAPKEVATFIDTVDFSIQENESYDRDVAKVQRLEDKIRLGQLLREIQKNGDDLREELNGLLISEDGAALKTSARFLWASHRSQLEDRVRRLDLLRMRFLVVYLGIISSIADKQPPPPPPLPRDSEKVAALTTPTRPLKPSAKSLNEQMTRRPPVRRLTTQAIGHQENVPRVGRNGWAGVVHELQTSPRMHQRHASIERAMSMSPS